jgi:hypothetical protein
MSVKVRSILPIYIACPASSCSSKPNNAFKKAALARYYLRKRKDSCALYERYGLDELLSAALQLSSGPLRISDQWDRKGPLNLKHTSTATVRQLLNRANEFRMFVSNRKHL